jgi:hypothetical protein
MKHVLNVFLDKFWDAFEIFFNYEYEETNE